MSPLDAVEAQHVVLPRLAGVTDGDANAADAVMTALMLALRHRQRTGEGQFVATSMIGGNVLAYAEDFNRYDGKVPSPRPTPRSSAPAPFTASTRPVRAGCSWRCRPRSSGNGP